jgi:CBS domain-containing membrane protein
LPPAEARQAGGLASVLALLQGFLPAVAPVAAPERVRAGLGALLGMALTGSLSQVLLHDPVATIWLIAPMGASAVLLFGIPASPLAQPWSFLMGNVVAALIGVASWRAVPDPLWAAAIAVGVAIAVMLTLRCLHPPSGAVALTAVLGGPAIHRLGFTYVLVPVLLNSLLLLVSAMAYNRATGRRYPHAGTRPATPSGSEIAESDLVGFSPQDLDDVLRRHHELLDISRADLADILHETEDVAFQRRFGHLDCAAVMQADVPAVEFGTPLGEAWTLLRSNDLGVLPVIDRARRVIGLLTLAEFVEHADPEAHAHIGPRIGELIRRPTRSHNERPEVAGQLMNRRFWQVQSGQPVIALVPLLDERAVQHIAVVDSERRLIGMLTQAHIMHALYRSAGPAASAARIVIESGVLRGPDPAPAR